MTSRVRAVLRALSLLATAATSLPAQLTTPPDWKWVLDGPARWIASGDVADSAWTFVAMPPGWHLTTGPGAFVYHPAYAGRDQFSVEAEAFLFPGRSDDGWGIFFGGAALERPEARSYTAVLVRHDGAVTVISQRDGRSATHRAWQVASQARAQRGDSTARNAIRADVTRDSVTVRVNGERLAAFDRSLLPVDGTLGFRLGRSVNLHVIRLDVTYRLAPVPTKR